MAILMKGKVWRERHLKGKLRFGFPFYVEPKVDDIRCRVVCVRSDVGEVANVLFESYAEKPLHNLDAFKEMFCRYFDARQGLNELDVGIQVNGNFDDSYKWTRSSTKIPAHLDSSMVVFHLFDMPDLGTLEYQKRREFIKCAVDSLRTYGLRVADHLCVVCNSEREVEWAYSHYRTLGYEGAMGKTHDHRYEKGKRTFGWYKLKPEDTYDGKITGLVEAVAGVDQPELGIKAGDLLGRTGAIEVVLEDGSVARPHGIAHALGTDMHNNPDKYIGQWVEFAAMERDRQGGYRHPVFRRLREAKQ